MLGDAQVGFVVEQAIEHIGGIAHADVDDLTAEGDVLVRDVGVKQPARLGPVLGVEVPGALGPSPGPEPLPIRRRGRTIAPVGREGVAQLRVDQFGQSQRVRIIPDVPSLQPGKLGGGAAGAGFGHLREAQVQPIGRQGRQQQGRVFGRGPGF